MTEKTENIRTLSEKEEVQVAGGAPNAKGFYNLKCDKCGWQTQIAEQEHDNLYKQIKPLYGLFQHCDVDKNSECQERLKYVI